MKYVYIAILFLFGSCREGNKAPQATDAATNENAKSVSIKDKTVQFLWRDTSGTLLINQDFCKTITDAEKAALGYVATFIGNECEWDGKPTKDRSNLKCEILTALNLGYQCSEQHLGFLKKWFKNDTTVLEEIKICPTTPNTSTIQDTFDEIVVTTKGNDILISFKANGIHLREQKEWEWSETAYFKVQNEYIQLIKKDRSKVKVSSFNADAE